MGRTQQVHALHAMHSHVSVTQQNIGTNSKKGYKGTTDKTGQDRAKGREEDAYAELYAAGASCLNTRVLAEAVTRKTKQNPPSHTHHKNDNTTGQRQQQKDRNKQNNASPTNKTRRTKQDKARADSRDRQKDRKANCLTLTPVGKKPKVLQQNKKTQTKTTRRKTETRASNARKLSKTKATQIRQHKATHCKTLAGERGKG